MSPVHVEDVLKKWGAVGLEFVGAAVTVKFNRTLTADEQNEFYAEFMRVWTATLPKRKIYLRLSFR